MKRFRLGMIVPSLNTIAEDDFRTFCPDDVRYHVHRLRLRSEPGRVTLADLARAHGEAETAATFLRDLGPDAVAFNCTGASVAGGPTGDVALAESMTAKLGVPCPNTMVAIKSALRALRGDRLLHVCPFDNDSARIERESLLAGGFDIVRTQSLDFADARVAAKMEPEEIAARVRSSIDPSIGAVLLSCANVRAFEAAPALEAALERPVITSNQAMLWAVLRAAGWQGKIRSAGRLFEVDA